MELVFLRVSAGMSATTRHFRDSPADAAAGLSAAGPLHYPCPPSAYAAASGEELVQWGVRIACLELDLGPLAIMLALGVAAVADQGRYGADWSGDELDAIVADYFDMLAAEQGGRPYVKARHSARLMAQIGRTHRSIEFKHMNISAVLEELGRPTIRGYRAMPNYQQAILDAIERHLLRREPAWAPLAGAEVAETPALFLEPAPALQPPKARPPELERLVRKFDPGERDFRNRALGRAGEEAVFHFERSRLEAEARPDLARKVRWVAQEDGDGAGYDIHSFEPDGRDRLVEVKTTTGNRTTPFYLTRNEYALAEERLDAFRLMRVYSFAREPRMFELAPPLAEAVRLSPHTFQASFA